MPLWFRGQRDAAWDLEPSIWRHANQRGYASPANLEKNLVHRFRSRAGLYSEQTLEIADHSGWLQLMQHFGLPTRLLDWTRSPMVAAYFALESIIQSDDGGQTGPDRAIWVLAPHALNRVTTKGKHLVTPGIGSKICASLVNGAFWGDAWANQAAHRYELESRTEDGTQTPTDVEGVTVGPTSMAVMANETNLRLLLQQGAFTVHASGSEPLNTDAQLLSSLARFVVPGAAARAMAAELVACGFDESGIYPDLEHLANELLRTSPSGVSALEP